MTAQDLVSSGNAAAYAEEKLLPTHQNLSPAEEKAVDVESRKLAKTASCGLAMKK